MAGGTRSYEFARRWASYGHEVHVVTTSGDSRGCSGWRQEVVDGINIHWLRVPYDNRMSYARRAYAWTRFALRSSLRARRLRGDVVFATSTPLTIAIPGVAATLGKRSPMVFEVRDLWPEVPIALGALKNPVLRGLARWLERFAYRHSSAVVALSPDMSEGVRRAGYQGPVHTIPNASDLELFDVGPEHGKAFRDERPWLGSSPLVVYTGTFGRVNGVSYMVELAAECAARGSSAKFLAVGDGAEWDQIKSLADRSGVLGRNFFMERSLKKSQMPSVLSAATVGASWVIPVPALEANSANKFFDCLAAGLPIVINYGGWQRDLIEAEGVGIALHASNVSDAAESLVDFLDNSPALRSAGISGRRLARSRFSRDNLAAQLRGILETAAPNQSNEQMKGR